MEKESKKKAKGPSQSHQGTQICPNPGLQDNFFKVPTFQGYTLQGDVFIKVVDRSFRSTAMARYLESRIYYDINPWWSGIFVSRIRGP